MTAPGSNITPQPGWWVRTDRIGTNASQYGWDAELSGPSQGFARGGYGWSSSATGLRSSLLVTRPITATITPTLNSVTGIAVTDTITATITPALLSSFAVTPVAFDTETDNFALGYNYTFNHTATAGAYVIVDVGFSNAGIPTDVLTPSVTYNGVTMTQLALIHAPSGLGGLARFGLAGAPSGTKTVAVTLSGGTGFGSDTAGICISYKNVVSVATTTTATDFAGTNKTYSDAITCTTGQMIANVICSWPSGGSGVGHLTQSGGTNRYNSVSASSNVAGVVNTATANTTFGADNTPFYNAPAYWASISTVLKPT